MITNLDIIYLTKSLLRDALVKNTYWENQPIVPFSKSKANWLLRNNRIDENDLCAVIAYEENKLISFVYIIPDLFHTPIGIKKLYWVRTWWVADTLNNSVVGTYILNEAIKSLDKQVIIKFLSSSVKKFYEKQPYIKFATRKRYFIIFNLDANLLVGKFKFLKTIKPILNAIAKLSAMITTALIAKKVKKKTKNLVYEYLTELDESTWDYLKDKCKDDVVVKTREYINWQLSSTQYTKTLIKDKYSQHCLAIGALKKIYPISIKIIENNTIIGFISVLVRNNEFVVKYFVTTDAYFDKCLNALMENFIRTKTNTIHTENVLLGEKIQNGFINFYADIKSSYSLIHKNVSIDVQDMVLQDRDGHFA